MQKHETPLSGYLYWESKLSEDVFLRQPFNREFKEYTYRQAGEESRKIAAALLAGGLQEGDKVALLSKNCAHWIMSDLAMMMAGLVSVPIYPTLNAETIRHILEHSESKAIIVGKLDDYESQRAGIPESVRKIGIRQYGISDGEGWEDLVNETEPLPEIHDQKPDELMTIIYTSGTTGKPKGVMHKAGSFSQVINTAAPLMGIPDKPRFFSYLPLMHIAERVGIEMMGLMKGGTLSFPESLDTFADDLASVRPELFFAVPRIWAKFQEKILEKMPQKKLDRLLGLPLIGNIVKKKIRQKLGLNEAIYIVSGAAPIAPSLQEWYEKLGIVIHQAYGMTEDCVLSHFNLPGMNKFGTVGMPLPGCKAKISPEGEIRIKSDALMLGYYKEPELTAEALDEDGYLRTGDIGEYDHDQYLSITGRLKDQFKTDKGKYISPAPIEMNLLKNTDIDQVCMVGMGVPQPLALIIPSAAGKGKKREAFELSLLATIDSVNENAEKHEKIEKAIIMKEDWTIDNGLLTPTLKVKRNEVEKIHQPMYRDWYEMESRVIWE